MGSSLSGILSASRSRSAVIDSPELDKKTNNFSLVEAQVRKFHEHPLVKDVQVGGGTVSVSDVDNSGKVNFTIGITIDTKLFNQD